MRRRITILDVGSRTIRWKVRGKDFSEPAILLRDADGNGVAGLDAVSYAQHPRNHAVPEWPLRCCELPDNSTVELLSLFRHKMPGKLFSIAVPDWLTSPDQLNLLKVYHEAGFETIHFTPEMEAIRATTVEEEGVLYLHLGALRSSLAFFEDSVPKLYRSIRWGGNDLDERIRTVLRQNHRIEIGLNSARLLKEGYGQRPSHTILGRNIDSGKFQEIKFALAKLDGVFDDDLIILAENVRQIMAKSSGIRKLHLSGGLAEFKLLTEFLAATFQLPILCPPDPGNAVLHGMEKLL